MPKGSKGPRGSKGKGKSKGMGKGRGYPPKDYPYQAPNKHTYGDFKSAEADSKWWHAQWAPCYSCLFKYHCASDHDEIWDNDNAVRWEENRLNFRIIGALLEKEVPLAEIARMHNVNTSDWPPLSDDDFVRGILEHMLGLPRWLDGSNPRTTPPTPSDQQWLPSGDVEILERGDWYWDENDEEGGTQAWEDENLYMYVPETYADCPPPAWDPEGKDMDVDGISPAKVPGAPSTIPPPPPTLPTAPKEPPKPNPALVPGLVNIPVVQTRLDKVETDVRHLRGDMRGIKQDVGHLQRGQLQQTELAQLLLEKQGIAPEVIAARLRQADLMFQASKGLPHTQQQQMPQQPQLPPSTPATAKLEAPQTPGVKLAKDMQIDSDPVAQSSGMQVDNDPSTPSDQVQLPPMAPETSCAPPPDPNLKCPPPAGIRETGEPTVAALYAAGVLRPVHPQQHETMSSPAPEGGIPRPAHCQEPHSAEHIPTQAPEGCAQPQPQEEMQVREAAATPSNSNALPQEPEQPFVFHAHRQKLPDKQKAPRPPQTQGSMYNLHHKRKPTLPKYQDNNEGDQGCAPSTNQNGGEDDHGSSQSADERGRDPQPSQSSNNQKRTISAYLSQGNPTDMGAASKYTIRHLIRKNGGDPDMLGNKATVTKNALISLASHKLPFGCYVLIQQPTVAGSKEYQVRTARVGMLPQSGSMPPQWLLGSAAQFPPPLKRGDFLPGQEQNLLDIPLKLTFPSMEEAQSMAAALNPPRKKPLS